MHVTRRAHLYACNIRYDVVNILLRVRLLLSVVDFRKYNIMVTTSDRPVAECAAGAGDREKATNEQTNHKQPLSF